METKDRIRKIMEDVRMSQQDFAAKLGISPASLSSIFTGRTNPTNNTVQAVHRAFPEISVAWLLFGEGEMIVPSAAPTAVTAEDTTTDEPLHDDSEPTLFSSSSGLGSPATTPVSAATRRGESSISSDRSIKSVKIVDKVIRRIREIRVFYDDGTYETFVPSAK